MKFLSFAGLLAATVLSLASCSKQYDTKVEEGTTNAGGSGFNWAGTAPMSAKINGTAFLATQMNVSSAAGYYYSVVGQQSGGSILAVSVPANAKEGKVYSMPTPAGLSGVFLPDLALISTTGKLKVITNNSTTLEGYFWSDLKDPNGLKDTIVQVTEGYFKVDKP